MRYAEYEGQKTYVVVRTTGFGVMEYPLEEHEVVFTSDIKEVAEEYGLKNFPKDKSGWTYNSYLIAVNTLTEEGTRLLKEFQEEFDNRLKLIKNNPNYTKHEINGNTIYVQHSELLDGPIKKQEDGTENSNT